MPKQVRCNNCMTVYEEDEGNLKIVDKCKICNTDKYLMDDFIPTKNDKVSNANFNK